MTDIYIWLSILAVALTGVVIYAIADKRRKRPNLSLHSVPTHYYRGYNPVMSVAQTNSGFTDGVIIGSAFNSHPVVEETVINNVVIEDPSSASSFSGFSGGDSGGGGATSDWSAPDTSCDVSSSDSSSCDTSDYGS